MERYENYNFKCLRCKDHGTRYLPSGATFTTCGTCGQLCKVSSGLNNTSNNNNNNNNQNTNFRSPQIIIEIYHLIMMDLMNLEIMMIIVSMKKMTMI